MVSHTPLPSACRAVSVSPAHKVPHACFAGPPADRSMSARPSVRLPVQDRRMSKDRTKEFVPVLPRQSKLLGGPRASHPRVTSTRKKTGESRRPESNTSRPSSVPNTTPIHSPKRVILFTIRMKHPERTITRQPSPAHQESFKNKFKAVHTFTVTHLLQCEGS